MDDFYELKSDIMLGMEIEQKLVEYLKKKYNPTALVLHGSRANGYAREHSDWDFIMFTKQDTKPLTREIVFGANIELKQVLLPVPEDKFLGFFFRTENTKILHDPESVAISLLNINDTKVKEGNRFTTDDRTKRYAFLSSALDGIRDYSDKPLNLFDKKIDFYTRAIDSWFRFIKNEFEPSHYIAFPRINEEDSDFYELISHFVSMTDANDLIRTGEEIISKLFPDLSQ
jgi:predicted nucleotidyltransferase